MVDAALLAVVDTIIDRPGFGGDANAFVATGKCGHW